MQWNHECVENCRLKTIIAQPLTKCSSNKGFRGKSSILPRSNFGVGGQESRPQSLTAATLIRYAALI